MNDGMNSGGFWVFGYGSLVWMPGFAYQDRRIARLEGFSRSFCMRSIHHRGTPQSPGLVLALDNDADGCCDGVAFYVAADHASATLGYLRERELISSAYLEKTLPITLDDAREVGALCYVVDPRHVQYCGGLPLETQARIIAGSTGGRGPNDEYLFNTAAHLRDLGIKDAELDWLARRVRDLAAESRPKPGLDFRA